MPRIGSTTTTPSGTGASGSADTVVLRVGSKGSAVEKAQRALAAAGFDPGTVDGIFGPKMKAAVIAFQKSRGLTADGSIGPKTQAELGRVDSFDPTPTTPSTPMEPAGPTEIALAPEDATEAEKWSHYAAIVKAAGGKISASAPTVLGLRGLSLDRERHESLTNTKYDDTFVVLTPQGRVYELRGATHPSMKDCTDSPDVTGDGKGDVGTIAPGNYKVVPHNDYMGNKSFQVVTAGGSGGLPGWRDTDHDGVYSEAEKSASKSRGDKISAVLFHQGTPGIPISIGCQTLPPAEFERFLEALGGAKNFTFTLVNGSNG